MKHRGALISGNLRINSMAGPMRVTITFSGIPRNIDNSKDNANRSSEIYSDKNIMKSHRGPPLRLIFKRAARGDFGRG
jgi:hypothetical protein